VTRPFVLFALVLTCLVCAAACATSKTHLIPPTASANDTTETTLSVQNDGFPDMDMYVIRSDGTRYRLGTALGNQTTVLEIPKFMLIGSATDLHFVADPINGQRASVSQTMSVSPGDEIDMIIPPS
jgi:hypothetical protein